MRNPKSLVSHFDFSGAHYDLNEIAGVLREDKDLLAAWAYNCGIEVTDERCVNGWPEKFWYFYNGWYCANHKEEFLTAANTGSTPCDHKYVTLNNNKVKCISCGVEHKYVP